MLNKEHQECKLIEDTLKKNLFNIDILKVHLTWLCAGHHKQHVQIIHVSTQ